MSLEFSKESSMKEKNHEHMNTNRILWLWTDNEKKRFETFENFIRTALHIHELFCLAALITSPLIVEKSNPIDLPRRLFYLSTGTREEGKSLPNNKMNRWVMKISSLFVFDFFYLHPQALAGIAEHPSSDSVVRGMKSFDLCSEAKILS